MPSDLLLPIDTLIVATSLVFAVSVLGGMMLARPLFGRPQPGRFVRRVTSRVRPKKVETPAPVRTPR